MHAVYNARWREKRSIYLECTWDGRRMRVGFGRWMADVDGMRVGCGRDARGMWMADARGMWMRMRMGCGRWMDGGCVWDVDG
jgi:hypothetical protein